MHKARLALSVCVAVLLVLCLGCSRDPNVRKRKYMESGKKYYETGKYREAGIQFSNALQIDPRDADAHYELAKTLVKLESWSNAYRELARTVDLQPDNFPAQLDVGNMLLASRDPKHAQEKAALVLQKQPNNPDAHLLLANCYAAQNDPTKAAAEMHRAIELAPNRAFFYLSLAVLQANEKQFADAEKSYQKAIQLDPSSLPAMQALARFYEMQQRWPDAEKQLKRAIMVAPKEVASRVELARLYMATNRRAEAENLLSETKNALAGDPQGYRLLADFYTSTGQTDKALAEFGALYEKHPQDLAVAKSYARLLIATGRYPAAERIDREILKTNPRDGDGIIIKGQLLTRQGHPDQATSVFEGALKNDADSPLLHYYYGNALLAVGDSARAESEWLQAATLNPNLLEVQTALAEAAVRRRDYAQLENAATAILRLSPSSPAGYIYRAAVEAARKENAKVEQDLQHAVSLAPDQPAPYIRLAGWRTSQNKPAEALKLYEKALELDPANAEAMQAISLIYAQQKQFPQLITRLNEQIAKAPNSSALRQYLGAALQQTNDLAGAAAALQKAVDLDNSNSTALLALAQVEMQLGNADKSISAFTRNIQQNPKDLRSYFMLGAVYEAQGNWQKAEELYKRVLEIQPGQPLAANNLAYLMLEHGGNVDVALSLAQKARQGLPQLTSAADTMAWAYYQRGAYSSAIDLLEEAAKKSPEDPNIHYHLGLCYQKTNKKDLARQHLQRALQLNPGFAHADDARKALAALGA